MFLTTKVATVSAMLPFVYPIMLPFVYPIIHKNKARASWGGLVVLAVLLNASFAASQDWATRIQDGIHLHHRYMHSRATKAIVAVSKEVGGDHQRQIAELLLDEANKLLSRPSDSRDEVGARGFLQSSMAVSVLLNDAERIYNAAGGFLLAGSSQEALEGYKRVQRMVPSLVAAYHQIGMTLSKMNKLEESIDAYNGALGLLPTYAISYNNLGVLLGKMGRTQEALGYYEAALLLDPQYEDAHNNAETARKKMEQEQLEAGVASLEQDEVRELMSHLTASASSSSREDQLRGLVEEAWRRMRKGVQSVMDHALKSAISQALPSVLTCSDSKALFSLGLVVMELANFTQAIRVFTRVTEVRPNSGPAHHQLGLALARSGEFVPALEAYVAAIKRDPRLAVSHNNMGVLYSKLGRLEAAEEHYKKALTIDPQYPQAERNLQAVLRTRKAFAELVARHKNASLGFQEAVAPERTPLVVVGYKVAGDGLGSHATHLLPLLQEARHARPQYNSTNAERKEDVIFFDTSEALDTPNAGLMDGAVVFVVVEPYRLRLPRGSREYRIYLTLFESDRLPPSWTELLNSNACEVWTTTEWNADSFRSSGVRVPVKVVPIGTAPPSLTPPWHASSHSKEFVFLLLANLQERKGVVETAAAFVAAFGTSNSVQLRVHAKWGDPHVIQALKSFSRFSNIVVTMGTLSSVELEVLWRDADCVVALSRGEAWGLVPREAVAVGIPVIVSHLPCWHDLKNISSGLVHFVGIAGKAAASYAFTTEETGDVLTWDELEAQQAFIKVFNTYAHAQRMPPASGTHATSHASPSWGQVAALYTAALDKKVLVFTKSLATTCGISAYTSQVFANLKDEFGSGVAFARTWSEVFVFARMFRLKVLHIQHEHGLHWDDNEFLHTLLAFQRTHPQVAIVVTMHSLNLGQQDRRSFYHRLCNIARLVTLNSLAVSRADFPLQYVLHGIPRATARVAGVAGVSTRLFRQHHVASFGFWDEQKRHTQLCEIAEDAGVSFDLYSQPPSEFGLAGCDGLVRYHRVFLDTPELIRRLSSYAALVFLRRPSDIFSASGSASMALLANVPVICEDSDHFRDLSEAIDLVPLDRIPARIKEVLSSESLRDHLVQRQNEYVMRNSEGEALRQHLALYASLQPLPLPNDTARDSADEHLGDGRDIEEEEASRRLSEKMNTFDDVGLDRLDTSRLGLDRRDTSRLEKLGLAASSASGKTEL